MRNYLNYTDENNWTEKVLESSHTIPQSVRIDHNTNWLSSKRTFVE